MYSFASATKLDKIKIVILTVTVEYFTKKVGLHNIHIRKPLLIKILTVRADIPAFSNCQLFIAINNNIVTTK